jgi:phosphoribosylpyrophosphate synthetase
MIIQTPISSLKELDYNPRKSSRNDLSLLAKSLQDNPEFFLARPIIASTRTGENIVIAGNMRLRAARLAGMVDVPVALLHGLTEEKEREIVARDNLHSGKWNFTKLRDNFDLDKLKEFGLDKASINKLLKPQVHAGVNLLAGSVYRPTFNRKRGIRFLSIRKFIDSKKRSVVATIKNLKAQGDAGLVDFMSREITDAILETCGKNQNIAYVPAPIGYSANLGAFHLATAVTKTVANNLCGEFLPVFTPQKKEKRDVSEYELRSHIQISKDATIKANRLHIIIDDISTTGTTICSCLSALMDVAPVLGVVFLYESGATDE